MPEWISVKERMPEKNGTYLCFSKTGIATHDFALKLSDVDKYDFSTEHRCGFYEFDSDYGYFEIICITHWMPLPEPPKGEEEK